MLFLSSPSCAEMCSVIGFIIVVVVIGAILKSNLRVPTCRAIVSYRKVFSSRSMYVLPVEATGRAISSQQTAATSHKKCKESKRNTRCQDRSQVWYQIRQTNSKGNYSNRNNSNNSNRMSSSSGRNNIYSGFYYFIKYSTISSECPLLFHVTM